MFPRIFVLILLCVFASAGCQRGSPRAKAQSERQLEAKKSAPAEMEAISIDDQQVAGGEAKNDPANPNKAPVARKIKYTADLRIIIDDFDKGTQKLKEAIKEAEGVVAQSEISGSAGQVRSGRWRVRVPVKQFDAFRDAVASIGDVEQNRTDSEDVTEEYYDLEAHIKNRQSEEESLRKLLEKSSGDMKTFLAIQSELNRTRDDINRKQGRLKLLANLTDLTTVSIALRERQKFEPAKGPESVEKVGFGTKVGRTFRESGETLLEFVEAVALFVVAVAPWFPVLLAVGLSAWWFAKRARPKATLPATPASQPASLA